jgi:predicted NUDIX family NTP pyrophosphohydrolase
MPQRGQHSVFDPRQMTDCANVRDGANALLKARRELTEELGPAANQPRDALIENR